MSEFEKVKDISWQRLTNDELNFVQQQIKMARTFLQSVNIRTTVIGDTVEWDNSRGRGVMRGTVVKVNRKKVVVDVGNFQKWNVPANMIRHVD